MVTDEQLAALEARLEALHAAQLISDDELFAVEDCVADFFEAKAVFDGMGGVAPDVVTDGAPALSTKSEAGVGTAVLQVLKERQVGRKLHLQLSPTGSHPTASRPGRGRRIFRVASNSVDS